MTAGLLAVVCGAAAAPTPAADTEAVAPAPVAKPSASTPGVALVRVRLPLTGSDDADYERRIRRVIQRLTAEPSEAGRPRLVLELVPGEATAATPLERALGLARFLVSDAAAGVRTLAYVPQNLAGHAVLIALACEEIALAPEATLGDAGAGEDPSRPIGAGVRAFYEEIASVRRTAPPAVAIAMIDRAAELVRVETAEGTRLALRAKLDAEAAEGLPGSVVVSEEVLSPAGSAAAFTGREARAEGIAAYLAKDRATLARTLGVTPGELLEDRSLDDAWRPVMIDVAGPLTPRLARRVRSLLATELDQNRVNWVGFRIDSSGGDAAAGLSLAQTLADLDPDEVRTVAYVPRLAEGPATLVALACDQLIVQADAQLVGVEAAAPVAAAEDVEINNPADGADEGADEGANEGPGKAGADGPLRVGDGDAPRPDGPDQGQPGGPDPNTDVAALVASIRGALAPATERSWSLLAAAVDPALEVRRHVHRETGETRDLTPEELAELPDAAAWRAGPTIVAAGEPLRLDAAEAVRLGVAWREIDQFDDLPGLYGLDTLPRTAEPSWALELVEALASPGLATLLLVIGVVGLYIELSTPGLGLGGFLSTVAFLLFFWSKFLDGTADWLEALLFVAGVVFLLIEVVVLPGFGVFGLGGGLMVIAALVLAGQTFLLPKTPSQLAELRDSIGAVAAASVVCLAAGMVLRQYLPRSPLFRRAMLAPPEKADRIEQERREALADFAHLVGRRGHAVGDLLPGGRAEIDGELVDVIAHGDLIEKGDAVEVVSAQGARVVVRKA